MKDGLRFDMCGLETSIFRSTEIFYFIARVDNAILPHISYGCRFCADHLRQTTYDNKILDELRYLFDHRLLYWRF
jgi:hypothetical protein